jgi:hypothetical protein
MMTDLSNSIPLNVSIGQIYYPSGVLSMGLIDVERLGDSVERYQ